MALLQESLDFHLSPADPVGLVPVYLGPSDLSVSESHSRDAFELLPTARTKLLSQSHDISYPAADRNRLDTFDISNQLKVHATGVRD